MDGASRAGNAPTWEEEQKTLRKSKALVKALDGSHWSSSGKRLPHEEMPDFGDAGVLFLIIPLIAQLESLVAHPVGDASPRACLLRAVVS